MPLQATSGAASYDAFGGGVVAEPVYIEQIFSTYLYTGNGSTQTITNGIDLAGKGGLVWLKNRASDLGALDHYLEDTARGTNKYLSSNTTNQQQDDSAYGGSVTSFNSTGFSLGTATSINYVGSPAATFASWTFRKQPKFFDVVTFTSAASGSTTFNHNLGSTPGCVFIKSTQSADDWYVYHRIVGNDAYLVLNKDSVSNAVTGCFSVSSTSVTVNSAIMAASESYVAYVFAHDAGGFGLTGTDNVISCGSYTGTFTAGLEVNLGYEPQWVMIKRRSGVAGNWFLFDNMRGMPNGSADAYLYANASDAEANFEYIAPTATGFKIDSTTGGLNASGGSYIYIAIRRGPMKVPTSGTSVFSPIKAYNATGTKNTTNFAVDLQIAKNFTDGGSNNVNDRLRGVSSISTETTTSGPFLYTDTTAAEVEAYRTLGWDNTGFKTPGYFSNYDIIFYNFKRAPSFFDEVCYTGDGSARTVNHNLGVVPELMIVKTRNDSTNWFAYTSTTGNTQYLLPNATIGVQTATSVWNNTTPTASVFTLGSSGAVNRSGSTCVAYLFATCSGVSKVGSYTGNGTTQTINCGFTGGARFVLIKRTDSTGDWYVYDTARGMTTLTDPYLLLNSTAAESATLGSVTTVSTGFAVNASVLAAINTNAASYIFLAIA